MSMYTARASMLIRRPPAEVFDAFVNPAKLTLFWLDGASAPLAPGAKVEWRFMVPGVVDTLTVTTFEPPRRLAFAWPDGTSADLRFDEHGKDATRVTVEAKGFEGDDAVTQVANNTEGYTIVLCDLKTLLETGSSANLVRDKAALIAAT